MNDVYGKKKNCSKKNVTLHNSDIMRLRHPARFVVYDSPVAAIITGIRERYIHRVFDHNR